MYLTISQIKSAVKDVCLDIGLGNSQLEAVVCHGLRGNQGFMFTDDHQIRSGRYCLAASLIGKPVRKDHCIDKNVDMGEQYWAYNKEV